MAWEVVLLESNKRIVLGPEVGILSVGTTALHVHVTSTHERSACNVDSVQC